MAMLVGLNPRRVYECTDSFMLSTYTAAIERADDILADWRDDLAHRIANAVGELFKGT